MALRHSYVVCRFRRAMRSDFSVQAYATLRPSTDFSSKRTLTDSKIASISVRPSVNTVASVRDFFFLTNIGN
jgi:hypothetical protein